MKVYTLVRDSNEKEANILKISTAINKIMKVVRETLQFVLPQNKLGMVCRELVEYMMGHMTRNINISCCMEKLGEVKKK